MKLIDGVKVYTNAFVDLIYTFNKMNDPMRIYYEDSLTKLLKGQRIDKFVSANEYQHRAYQYKQHIVHMINEWNKLNAELFKQGIDSTIFDLRLTQLVNSIDDFVNDTAFSEGITNVDFYDELNLAIYKIHSDGIAAINTLYDICNKAEKLDLSSKGKVALVEHFKDFRPDRMERRLQAVQSGKYRSFIENRISWLEAKTEQFAELKSIPGAENLFEDDDST